MDASRFTGTEPLAADASIDLARLQAYLRANLEGCGGRLTVERFRGGQSNPTMLLSFDGKPSLVLRKKPNGKLLPSAHAVDREFRVIRALRGSDVPVARARLLCIDESIVGTMFYVMDFVEGRSFWAPALPDQPPAERRVIYREMNRVAAALHKTDYSSIGLGDFGKPVDYVARQVARWTRQYQASQTGIIEAMDRLIEWLPGNIPPQTGIALIHGDFRIDNLIFHPSEPRVLAVVDWELSTLGEPMADFAYHMLTWHLPNRPYRGLGDLDIRALAIPDERSYRDAYLQASGQAGVSERHWCAYLAYSLFRVAAIRQGIMKRVLEGNAASAHAREAGALAGPMAALGWHYAEKAMKS